MTDLHLPRLDLARAVTDALGRGRYVLMTDGAGRPQEITLDLKERPDDLFGGEVIHSFDWAGKSSPGRLNAAPPSDDHGPAIPVQRDESSAGVRGGAMDRGYAEWHREITEAVSERVYEFAAQDTRGAWDLSMVLLADAPDQEAAARADWVHVYDRVTRERRTLKRPEPDRILTGLRDVAADLRGKPVEPPFGCKPRD